MPKLVIVGFDRNNTHKADKLSFFRGDRTQVSKFIEVKKSQIRMNPFQIYDD